MSGFDAKKTSILEYINTTWDQSIVPVLSDYIKIPNQSPAYDKDWKTNGLIDKAMDCLVDWAKAQNLENVVRIDLHKDPDLTPFLVIEIAGSPGSTQDTILMYGHMDKQPPMDGWDEGLGPYTPVIKDEKLYGRGGADDGYAICAAVTAVKALQLNKIPHGRIVITIEGSEESGSPDLPHYMKKCAKEIGDIGLVLCLDSGAFTYDRMWLTGSLRGVVGGCLTVEGIKEPMHSGLGGGVCPCPFRIARSLLDRIEDPYTGIIKLGELYCPVQPDAIEGFKKLDAVGPDIFMQQFPFPPTLTPEIPRNDQTGLLVRNNWHPCLTVTGLDGLPGTAKAGNVLRSKVSLKLSIRLPPNVECDAASEAIRRVLEANPPYNAKVTYKADKGGNGWAAKPLSPWLSKAVDDGSTMFFGCPSGYSAIGGSIPFMKMLGDMFPASQFVITGVLGPQSNAHGPNEFLHIPFGKKLTGAVAKIVAEQFLNLRK
eukprot:PhF_6_TR32390/c0_g1_i1/m.48050